MTIHLTACTRRRSLSLLTPAIASHLWRCLWSAFPEALAAVLMATHLHLIATRHSPEAAQNRLRAVLSGCSRRRLPVEGRVTWEPVEAPVEIPDSRHLARQVRYVVLNPCRAGLVDDPLRWLWSTHRDVMGAVAQPWVQAHRLAAALDRPAQGFASAHHRYVSSDPSVDVAGTAPPVPAKRRTSPAESIERIARAAAAALQPPRCASSRSR
jgi:REP element-mobilizing transposase RayT